MTRIQFIDVNFPPSNLPSSLDIESRLKRHLHQLRQKTGTVREDYFLEDLDRLKVRRRTEAYLNAVARKSGMGHLDKDDRKKLEVFRTGAELKTVDFHSELSRFFHREVSHL